MSECEPREVRLFDQRHGGKAAIREMADAIAPLDPPAEAVFVAGNPLKPIGRELRNARRLIGAVENASDAILKAQRSEYPTVVAWVSAQHYHC